MMGLQQGQSEGSARVEAIDLTLSSPEPESRSQHRSYDHTPQQQRIRTVKEEARSSHRTTHRSNDNARRHGVTRGGNPSRQQQHRINPQHVKQMIDTTNHRALRSVILQLCETSPALCGALVRGLGPHSPWAQALISRQRARSYTQTRDTSKTESRTNGQGAHERTKRRLSGNDSPESAASQMRADGPLTVHDDRGHLRLPPSSRKTSTVKREHRASSTDSDDSTNIVDFSAIEQDAQRREPAHHAAVHGGSKHHSTSRQNTERLISYDHFKHSSLHEQKRKLCSQCGDLFEDDNSRCYFHPGEEGPTRAGNISPYTCCNKFAGEPGCRIGRHTSEKPDTPRNTKRPSPSPRSGGAWSKKPRIL